MKPNYYTIHPNKKPKNLFKKRRYDNTLGVRLAMLGAIGRSQIQMIASQPYPKYQNPEGKTADEIKKHKVKNIADVYVAVAEGVIKSIKDEKQRKFKLTGRYER